MTKIKTTCRDHQAGESAVKCLSQGHNRMVQVGFEPRPCRSQSRRSNHSTMLPIANLIFKAWYLLLNSKALNSFNYRPGWSKF